QVPGVVGFQGNGAAVAVGVIQHRGHEPPGQAGAPALGPHGKVDDVELAGVLQVVGPFPAEVLAPQDEVPQGPQAPVLHGDDGVGLQGVVGLLGVVLEGAPGLVLVVHNHQAVDLGAVGKDVAAPQQLLG